MGGGFFVYFVEEGPHDLTLVDTCFLAELPKLEAQIRDQGHDIRDVKRLVLTHVHGDHIQSANEIKRISGAKVHSHWLEAAYLKQDPPYHGPPNPQTIQNLIAKSGKRMEDVGRKFGNTGSPSVIVDEQLKDGDMIGTLLTVIHTPGHTPGHISLFSEEDGAIIGGDCLFKSIMGVDGLFVPPPEVSLDSAVAAISVRRIAQIHFDKLMLTHQDSPVLEDAQREVERVARMPPIRSF